MSFDLRNSNFLGMAATAVCLSMFVCQLPAQSISIPIVDILDDVEESLEDNTTFDQPSSDLELGTEGPPEPRQAVGLRFRDIPIPPGSTVSNAGIQFMVDEDDNVVTNVRIFGELAPNSGAFELTPSNVSGRTRTVNSVLWSEIPEWVNEGDSGPDQLTPDLSSIVQEILDQPDWTSGNAMSFIVLPDPITDNTGERTAISFDKVMDNPGSGFQPPTLNIDFVVPEPSSLGLFAVGLGVCLGLRRRRR